MSNFDAKFDTRTMLGMVEEAEFKPTSFLRDRFFPNVRTFDTAFIEVDIVGAGGRKVAPFVHPKIGGKVIEHEGYTTNSYKAPEVSPWMITEAEEMLKRAAGESVYGAMSPEARAAAQVGRDLRKLDEIITRREELMCSEALFTGRVTVKGEGYDEVINFWPADTAKQPKTTLADGELWTAEGVTAAQIMANLRMVRRTMIQKGGNTPNQIIVGNAVLEAMLEKLQAAGALDNRRVDLGHIDPQQLPNGVTYWGFLKDSALDIYSYDEWYINDEGVEAPIVPADLVLMAGNAFDATTMAYGCTSVADKAKGTLDMYAAQRVPVSKISENPDGRIVQIKARPLPIVNRINAFHVIKAA